MKDVFKRRLARLREQIAERELDALLISSNENRRYISGFAGSSGCLLISQQDCILATDFRYVEQAQQESPGFEIFQTTGSQSCWLPALVNNHYWENLGFEAAHTSFSTYEQLRDALSTDSPNIQLIPCTGLVERLRQIKEPEEHAVIRKAVDITDMAFTHLLETIRPGVLEKEVSWELESFFRRSGADGCSFDIIVASGPNSALPHARPGNRPIKAGEPIVIDMGAMLDGYCSDFTRTICLDSTDETLEKIYNITLKAQKYAIDNIKAGMSGSEADLLARKIIESDGYGDAFGHGLGHGIGLEIHELPSLSKLSTDILTDGMVFTVEPGIYLPDKGGVRIEDTVCLENGKIQVLTQSEKKLRY